MRFSHFLGRSWPPLGCSWAFLGRSWVSFEHLLAALGHLLVASGCACVPPGWILKGFGYLRTTFWSVLGPVLDSISDTMRLLLHDAQHGFHIRFSFSPCSAAVRAQHMESKRQGSFFMENPIFDESFIQNFETNNEKSKNRELS